MGFEGCVEVDEFGVALLDDEGAEGETEGDVVEGVGRGGGGGGNGGCWDGDFEGRRHSWDVVMRVGWRVDGRLGARRQSI